MTEEHDLPTEKAETIEESPQMRQARLWIHLDGVAHKIKEAAKELQEGAEGNGVSAPAQVHAGGHANVNNNNFRMPIPRSRWELTVIVVLFVLLAISLIVNGLDYARNSRNDEMLRQTLERDAEKVAAADAALAKAKVDLKTQVWLRSDSLTKENAEIRGDVKAIEIVLQSQGIAKGIPKIKPLTVLPDPLPEEYQ
jgi:hypothetical protein